MKISRLKAVTTLLNMWGHDIVIREYTDAGLTFRSYVVSIDNKKYTTADQVKAKRDLDNILEAEFNERETSEEESADSI